MIETLRPPTEGDLPLVAALMSRDWPEPIDESTVRRDWSSPRVDLELDARLGDDSYALVDALDDGRVWIDVRGRPSRELLDWAESRAREKGSRIFSGGWSSNVTLLEELERRGFGFVRHSHRMEIELVDGLPAPSWPSGIEVRTFRPGDERPLYELQHEAFADTWEPIDEPYDVWAHWLLQPPAFVPDLWFLAVQGIELVGFAICHPHPASGDLGWVRILGVRRRARGRGLGRALLLHAFHAFRARGLRRAGLGVDAESLTGAHRLYERAGMRVSARFDIYEKDVT